MKRRHALQERKRDGNSKDEKKDGPAKPKKPRPSVRSTRLQLPDSGDRIFAEPFGSLILRRTHCFGTLTSNS